MLSLRKGGEGRVYASKISKKKAAAANKKGIVDALVLFWAKKGGGKKTSGGILLLVFTQKKKGIAAVVCSMRREKSRGVANERKGGERLVKRLKAIPTYIEREKGAIVLSTHPKRGC